MDQELTPAIISPAPDATSFTVGGVTYTQTDGLAVGRARFYDRLGIEFGLNTKLPGIAEGLDTLKASLNKLDFVKAATVTEQLRQGVNIIGANRVREVEIVGMFYNAPGEDPAAYNFEAMQTKCYKAWGAVHSGFFLLAAIRLLKSGYGPYTPSLSKDSPPESETPGAE